MKSIKYLYEMDSLKHLFTNDELVIIHKYIDTQVNRLNQLIRSGSMNTAMEVSKDKGVDLFGAQSMVMKKRADAILFWEEKKKEIQ